MRDLSGGLGGTALKWRELLGRELLVKGGDCRCQVGSHYFAHERCGGNSRALQILRSSRRKFAFCERFERLGGVVRGRAYPKLKMKRASVVLLKPLVKKKPLILDRERSLNFLCKSP